MAKRIKTWLKRVALLVLGLLLTAGVTGWWLLGTASGGNWLLHTALPYATPYLPDNMRLELDGLETDSVADISIARLRLSDAEGVWLEIERLRLSWHPFSLLKGVVSVNELSAGNVTFHRPPLALEEAPEQALRETIAEALQTVEQLPQTLSGLTLPPARLEKLAVGILRLPDMLPDELAEGLPQAYTLDGSVALVSAPLRANVELKSLEGIATTATLAIEGVPRDFTVSLNWREAESGLIGQLLPLAAPAPIHIDADARIGQKTPFINLSANAGSEQLLRLTLDGTAFSAELPQPSLLTPLAAQASPIALQGTVTGGDSPALDMTLRTDAYAIDADTRLQDVAVHVNLFLRDAPLPFSLQTDAQTALHAKDTPALPLSLALQAQGSPEAWRIEALKVTAAQSQVSAQGEIGLEDGSASLTGESLLVLPLEADAEPAQTVHARFGAQVSDMWETPVLNASLEIDEIKAELPEEARKILALPVKLTVSSALPDIHVAVESATLNGEAVYHSAASAATDVMAQATLRLNAPDYPAVRAEASYRADQSGDATLSTTGTQPIHLSARYKQAGDILSLSDLKLRAADAFQFAGDVSLNTATTLATGRLSGSLHSLAPLEALGIPVPRLQLGKGDLTLALTAPRNQQHAALTFDARDIAMDDGIQLDAARLKADALLPAGKSPELDARLEASGLSAPVELEKATVYASGTLEQLAIQVDVKKIAGEYDVASRVKLALSEEATTITLQQLTADWPKEEQQLRLVKETTVRLAGETIELTPTELHLNDKARINAQANFGPDTVVGSLNVRRLAFADMPVAAARQIQGGLDFEATLSGKAANPQLEFAVTSKGLQKNYPRGGNGHRSKALIASIKGKLAGGQLSAHLDVDAEGGESTLDGNVAMPFTLSLAPGAYEAVPGGTLDASLKADIILTPFLPLFLPDGIYGDGHLSADFTVKGALEEPDINGRIALDSGRVEVLSTGTVLNDITLKASANGNRITIDEGSASDGGDGRIALSGFVELTPETPLDVTLSFRQATLMQQNNANATLSGDLHLAGDATASRFSGELNVDRARLTIAAEEGKSTAPELPVQEVASLEEPIAPDIRQQAEKAAKEKGDFAHNMALDLAIRAANQIFVEGFGLDAELKAEVDIKGTAADPKLEGKMETIRGRWEFVGRNFTITRGEATLRPDNLADPLLNIQCQVAAGDATAIATIRGGASKPDITFSSIPAMPQDEILARVMFGKNLRSISPIQAIELAQMLAVLSGKGGGISMVSKVKDAIGIDDLTVGGGNGADDPVTVGVGKHLADNVYLGVEGGAGENSGKVSVEVDLTPHISVETEARQNADTAIRFNYKYDY